MATVTLPDCSLYHYYDGINVYGHPQKEIFGILCVRGTSHPTLYCCKQVTDDGFWGYNGSQLNANNYMNYLQYTENCNRQKVNTRVHR